MHGMIGAMPSQEHVLLASNATHPLSVSDTSLNQDSVEILAFDPQYRQAFCDLNMAWLEELMAVEPPDIRILENPEREIIDLGGYIFFARCESQIVGTCALLNMGKQTFELIKMAVDKKFQGRQIGKKLLLAAIHQAKAAGARFITLETADILTAAVNLYTKVGFVLAPFEHESEYERETIFMKLDLGRVEN